MTASAPQALAFRIAGERFALPAAAVAEVVRALRTVPVPHAPASLTGLAGLRGKVLPVVALAALLGRPAGPGGRVIVLRGSDPVGLLVDAVIGLEPIGVQALLDVESLLAPAFGAVAAPASRRRAIARLAPDADVAARVELLSFAVAGQDYALPIAQVQAVARLPAGSAPASSADPAVLGSMTHRGDLLPLLSLRALLGVGGSLAAGSPRVLVVRIEGQSVGLAVDAAHGMLRVARSAIDEVPAVLARATGEARIQAICRVAQGSRLVSVLDADHIVAPGRIANSASIVEARAEEDRQATEAFVVFRMEGHDLGLPVAAVREVVTVPGASTRIPRAPFLHGIMNHRGRPIPLIDKADAAGGRRTVLVVADGANEAGLLIEGSPQVRQLPVSGAAAIRVLAPGELLRGIGQASAA